MYKANSCSLPVFFHLDHQVNAAKRALTTGRSRFGFRLRPVAHASPLGSNEWSRPRSLKESNSWFFFSSEIRAFSLIEVVLAMGIFSFAVLSVVGVMSVGLDSVSTSNNSFAVANITRSLRANYQSMSYSTAVPAANPGTTPSPTYFTGTGYPTSLSASQNINDPIYYTVTCTPTETSNAPGSLVNSQNAAVVAVQVSYPYPANAKTDTFSLFLAQ